jgi:HlyD family secretion protein
MNAKILKWGAGAMLLLAMAACKSGDAATTSVGYATAVVKRGDILNQADASGTVQPIRQVDVKSKASGEIIKLHVDVGDTVHTGELLAEVDPRDVQNNYDQAKANLDVANKSLQISKSQLDRSKDLLKAGVITQEQYESNELNYANAVASQVRAQTSYELAQKELSDATIVAPMSGTILTRSVSEGQVIQSASQNVSGGTTLFTMANLAEMQVVTLVDETDVGALRAGMQATVKVDAFPDRTFAGKVLKIEPQAVVQSNVTNFNVIIDLDNRDRLLKPGMNAEVTILENSAPNVLMVPNGAIVQPREVGPAAMALGLDVDNMDLSQFMAAGRGSRRNGGDSARGGGQSGGFRGQGGQGAQGDRAAFRGQGGQEGQGSQRSRGNGSQRFGGRNTQNAARFGFGPEFDSLRAKVARGELTQDSMRVLAEALRQKADSAADPTVKSVVVFVMKSGKPAPLLVQVGINDWDNTAVVSGLKEGDTLAIVSAAQLQQQQQAFLDRMRQRMGGSPFGGGGGGMRRGGR